MFLRFADVTKLNEMGKILEERKKIRNVDGLEQWIEMNILEIKGRRNVTFCIWVGKKMECTFQWAVIGGVFIDDKLKEM